MNYKKTILISMVLSSASLIGCAHQDTSMAAASNSAKRMVSADVIANFDISKISCWELSTLPENDATYASILLYGYAAGQQGKTTHSEASIESGITNASTTCASNPDMMAVEAFK